MTPLARDAVVALDAVRAAGLVVAGLLVLLGAYLAGRRDRPAAGHQSSSRPWRVSVETVLLSRRADGLAYRVQRGDVAPTASPDQAALELSGLAPTEPGSVLHATSWRFEDAGHLVLTYTGLPDPSPGAAVPLRAPSVVCSTDPVRPRPDGLHRHHVAAHGVRHLAYLVRTDPTMTTASSRLPALWDAVRAAARSMPVGEHDLAHQLAGTWDA